MGTISDERHRRPVTSYSGAACIVPGANTRSVHGSTTRYCFPSTLYSDLSDVIVPGDALGRRVMPYTGHCPDGDMRSVRLIRCRVDSGLRPFDLIDARGRLASVVAATAVLIVLAVVSPALVLNVPVVPLATEDPAVGTVVVSLPPAQRGASAPSPTPTPSSPASFPPLAPGVVPILYLHRVVAPPDAWLSWSADTRRRFLSYDVIPAAFEADLDWLVANGYTTILPRDLADHWDHRAPLPARPVIITLDDGGSSWVRTVLPALAKRGMVAEFYLTLDSIRYGRITWAEVNQLANAGMGIGAHDVHHVQLAVLGDGRPDASPDVMWAEVEGARQIIGEHIGTRPDSMAYVGGGFDASLVTVIQKAGYTTARSIIRGIEQPVGDRFELRVIAVAPHDDVVDPYTGTLVPGLPTFAAKIAGTVQ